MVDYDYKEFNEMITVWYDVDEICESIEKLNHNYIRNFDVDFADQFKEDMSFIEFMTEAFKTLKKQKDKNNK